jgi:two-component system NtrC family sensor kinase
MDGDDFSRKMADMLRCVESLQRGARGAARQEALKKLQIGLEELQSGLNELQRDLVECQQAETLRARELAAVTKAGQAIVSSLDKEAILNVVIVEVKNLLGAEGVSVLLRESAPNGSGDQLVFAAATGPGTEALVGTRMPATLGIAGWALREKVPALVSDALSDPRFYSGIDIVTHLNTRSVIAVPLIVKGTASGVIEVINKAQSTFGEHDLEILETMAGAAAIAIENARLYQLEREQFRRLQQSQAQLIQAEKMAALGRLIASITHEINNPLQAVQNCLTLAGEELQGGPHPQKLQRYLDLADSEIERITNIVRRMRDFYRPTREEMQPTDVCAVLDSVLELTAKQLQNSNVRVIVECDRGRVSGGAGALPMIRANPNQLKQVFLNLVLNAIDSMSPQGGTLRIRMVLDQTLQREHQVIPAVRAEFSDTGHGMSPEVLSQIFEPFFTTKSNGTGLGLAISYEIIRAHGGQITAASQVGGGTTFTILLPVVQL